jgi:hypothetical protein
MFVKVFAGLLTAGALAGTLATGAIAAPAAASPSAAPAKPQATKNAFGGVVTAITETQVTVKNAKAGSKTFLRSASTVVVKGRNVKSSWSEIEVNSRVLVRYREENGKVYAARVRIGRPHVAGMVQSVNGNAITIQTRDGKQVRLTVNSSTKYVQITGKKQRQPGKLGDIHAGTRLIAAGSYDSAHNFDAARIAYRNK